MSYQERNSAVSLVVSLLLLGFYGMSLYRMNEDGNLTSTNVFSLWATVIVLAIIVNIAATIITYIVFYIITKVRTDEEETDFVDERDKLIGLKGTRNAYVVFGIGVFISMGTLVINMPVLVMFNLLIFSGMIADIFGHISRLYLYQRGV